MSSDLLEEQRRRAEAWLSARDIDHETAFGQASAGEQRNGPVSLLAAHYQPHEISGENSEETIENLLGILDMKISALEGRVSDEHLDELRRRRSALEDVLDSPVPEYDHALQWGDIQALAFEEDGL